MTLAEFGESLCKVDNNELEISSFICVLGGVEFQVNEIGFLMKKRGENNLYATKITLDDKI